MRLAIAALLSSLAVAAAGSAAPSVIVVSLDGVRHDYLDRGELPALDRMSREGVRAERFVPVYPSNTFPAHVSMATGAPPNVHGIYDNRFFDRERGFYSYEADADWIEAEPLWAAAERQGVPAATFFWVGSETEWRGIGARHRMSPFDSGVGEARKVARIAEWLALPTEERPRLIMTWWHGADRVGHRRGPDHPETVAALEEQDRHLDALFAILDERELWSETTVLVVSDHGMRSFGETIPVRDALAEAGIEAKLVLGTAVAHVFLDAAADRARAEDILATLEGVRIQGRDEWPAALHLVHPSRTGDLVLHADPPRTFIEVSAWDRFLRAVARPLGVRPGLHGYAPDHPDMAGVFLALGRGVGPGGRLGAVSMLDLAATVAKLLGIAPPAHSQGSPIEGIGD